MITVNGRFFARIVMGLAGLALLALGAVAYKSNRITVHDVLAGVIVIAVGAIAALWLRLHGRPS